MGRRRSREEMMGEADGLDSQSRWAVVGSFFFLVTRLLAAGGLAPMVVADSIAVLTTTYVLTVFTARVLSTDAMRPRRSSTRETGRRRAEERSGSVASSASSASSASLVETEEKSNADALVPEEEADAPKAEQPSEKAEQAAESTAPKADGEPQHQKKDKKGKKANKASAMEASAEQLPTPGEAEGSLASTEAANAAVDLPPPPPMPLPGWMVGAKVSMEALEMAQDSLRRYEEREEEEDKAEEKRRRSLAKKAIIKHGKCVPDPEVVDELTFILSQRIKSPRRDRDREDDRAGSKSSKSKKSRKTSKAAKADKSSKSHKSRKNRV